MLKNYFTFSKSERNGIFVLALIIVILTIVMYIIKYTEAKSEVVNYKEFDAQIAEFKKYIVPKAEDENISRLDKFILDRYDSLQLFPFDPNTTSDEEWLKLGLTAKQIKTINTYKDRGGRFFERDDFRKIYGIRHKQYQILEPFIQLPEKAEFVAENKRTNDNANSNIENDVALELFNFDPNNTSAEDWKKLGMTDKQISTIQNFISKGGKFKTKQDLSKIYGITTEQMVELDPYIQLPDVLENKKSKIENTVFEINTVTPDELRQIDGLNDYLANSIIRYRNGLGGFVKITQLREVNGMTSEIFETVKERFTTDPTKVMKISLNFAEKEELNRHPYLEFKEAKAIVDYRTDNGPYKTIETLLTKKVVSEFTYSKIKDYLAL